MAEAFRMDSPAEQAERRRKQLDRGRCPPGGHTRRRRGVARVGRQGRRVRAVARVPVLPPSGGSALQPPQLVLGRPRTAHDPRRRDRRCARARLREPGLDPGPDPAALRPAVATRRLGAAAARVPTGVRHPDPRLEPAIGARSPRPGTAGLGGAPSGGSAADPRAAPDRDRASSSTRCSRSWTRSSGPPGPARSSTRRRRSCRPR